MFFGKSKEELEQLKAFYTASEIKQQPSTWLKTWEIVNSQKDEIKNFLKDKITKDTRIVLTGAGTSDYVGDTIVYELNKKLPNRVEAIASTDIVSNPYDYIEEDTKTILVSYARSGNSPESVGAYDLFQNNIKDVYQVIITCAKEGQLAVRAKECDNSLVLIMPDETNDKSFAMTSSFSCMTLATLLMFDIQNIDKNKEIVDIIASQGNDILDNKWSDIKELVDYEKKRVIYLGSGMLKGLCQEMALKDLELTSGKIVTLSEGVMSFRHGPKSIINDDTLVVLMASVNSHTYLYDLDLINEIHADSGNHKLAVISYNDKKLENNCDKYISISGKEIPEIYTIFNYMLFGQIYGFLNSLKLGISPDNPRPDGSVNRVVKGVTIHKYM